jgi:hypothetical protein
MEQHAMYAVSLVPTGAYGVYPPDGQAVAWLLMTHWSVFLMSDLKMPS